VIQVLAIPAAAQDAAAAAAAVNVMPTLVDVDSLHHCQASLSTAALSRWLAFHGPWPPIHTIVLGLRRYIIDGNHRAWICQIRGTPQVLAYDYWPADEDVVGRA
jgi:hypothetical protein